MRPRYQGFLMDIYLTFRKVNIFCENKTLFLSFRWFSILHLWVNPPNIWYTLEMKVLKFINSLQSKYKCSTLHITHQIQKSLLIAWIHLIHWINSMKECLWKNAFFMIIFKVQTLAYILMIVVRLALLQGHPKKRI